MAWPSHKGKNGDVTTNRSPRLHGRGAGFLRRPRSRTETSSYTRNGGTWSVCVPGSPNRVSDRDVRLTEVRVDVLHKVLALTSPQTSSGSWTPHVPSVRLLWVDADRDRPTSVGNRGTSGSTSTTPRDPPRSTHPHVEVPTLSPAPGPPRGPPTVPDSTSVVVSPPPGCPSPSPSGPTLAFVNDWDTPTPTPTLRSPGRVSSGSTPHPPLSHPPGSRPSPHQSSWTPDPLEDPGPVACVPDPGAGVPFSGPPAPQVPPA